MVQNKVSANYRCVSFESFINISTVRVRSCSDREAEGRRWGHTSTNRQTGSFKQPLGHFVAFPILSAALERLVFLLPLVSLCDGATGRFGFIDRRFPQPPPPFISSSLSSPHPPPPLRWRRRDSTLWSSVTAFYFLFSLFFYLFFFCLVLFVAAGKSDAPHRTSSPLLHRILKRAITGPYHKSHTLYIAVFPKQFRVPEFTWMRVFESNPRWWRSFRHFRHSPFIKALNHQMH